MSEMVRSWLVQRLERPHGGGILGADNPFSFGGGRKNGGLSAEAMGLIRGIFSFDYMGAAEFEYGAVPKALQAIAARENIAYSFSFPLAKVASHWRDSAAPTPEGEATVCVICPADWTEEVEDRIKQWASRDSGARLKEETRISDVLRPPTENPYPSRVCGWMELDNGFFFFTDSEMWKAAADLLGIGVSA